MNKTSFHLRTYFFLVGVFSLCIDANAQADTAKAQFPGGISGWQRYIMRNLTNDLDKKGAPPGNYVVRVNFTIDTLGNVCNVTPQSNPGYGTMEKAVRIISQSPKWTPATLNGEKIPYPKEQTITFTVLSKEQQHDSPYWHMRTDSSRREYYKEKLQTTYAKADSVISIEKKFSSTVKEILSNTMADKDKQIASQKEIELNDIKQILTVEQYEKWLKLNGNDRFSGRNNNDKIQDKPI